MQRWVLSGVRTASLAGPLPVLVILSRTAIAFRGQTRCCCLALRIAREATIGPAVVIFDAVVSGGSDGACLCRFQPTESEH
jgi:hypothetical protein